MGGSLDIHRSTHFLRRQCHLKLNGKGNEIKKGRWTSYNSIGKKELSKLLNFKYLLPSKRKKRIQKREEVTILEDGALSHYLALIPNVVYFLN